MSKILGVVGLLAPLPARVKESGPSLTITDMSTGIPDSFRDHVVNSTALGRLGTAEEIADVVAFLASNAGRWINGQTLYADGGYRG